MIIIWNWIRHVQKTLHIITLCIVTRSPSKRIYSRYKNPKKIYSFPLSVLKLVRMDGPFGIGYSLGNGYGDIVNRQSSFFEQVFSHVRKSGRGVDGVSADPIPF